MRTALLFALWLPLIAAASGVGVPASDFGEAPATAAENPVAADVAPAPPPLADKSPEQLHSPMLVYDQPVPVPVVAANDPEEETRTDKQNMKLSVPLGGGGGSSSSGVPPRTAPRAPPSANAPPATPPAYGDPRDPREATLDKQFTSSASPCSRDGYHNTAMKKGIDVAHRNCQLHQLDKNRSALWGLAGGDPLKRWVMEKQLDKALDVSKVR